MKSSGNREVRTIMHAYKVLNKHNRRLLLSIAEALVECSNAGRAHRPEKTARSLEALADGARGPATTSCGLICG
jgi:hypothetical protein